VWTAALVLAVALAAFVHVAHAHGHDRAAPPPVATVRQLPCLKPDAPAVAVVRPEFTDPAARPFQARAPPPLRA
jgi:hypothetical protein